MGRLPALLRFAALLSAAGPLLPAALPGAGGEPPPRAPVGITCCAEAGIRAAMAEEALARIAALAEGDARGPADFLSAQACQVVRPYLPEGGRGRRLEFLRSWLQAPAGGEAGDEFRALVENFVLGLTLEIGHTFQDEYDQAQMVLEAARRLVAALEKEPPADTQALSQALFRSGVSDRELRRLRSLERKWREAPAGADPFVAFNLLKKNSTGRAADPDQSLVFDLAGRYRAAHPFLDEFLENYRRLALDIRAAARRLHEQLAPLDGG